MALFGAVSALGGHSPAGRIIYDVVPLARSFRAWGRNLVLVELATVGLVGAGVVEVLARPRRYLRPVAIAAGALAAILCTLPIWTNLGGTMAEGAAGVVARVAPPSLLVVLLAAIVVATRSRRWGRVALVAVCAFDMILFALTAPWMDQQTPVAAVRAFYRPGLANFGAVAPAHGGVARFVAADGSERAYPLVRQVPSVIGYNPLLQANYALVAADYNYTGYPQQPDFWQPGWLDDVLQVTTLEAPDTVRPSSRGWTLTEWDRSAHYTVWVRTPRLNEAYLVGAAQPTTLAKIPALLRAPTTDLTQRVLVETNQRETAALTVGRSVPGPAGMVDAGGMSTDGHGLYHFVAQRPAILVVSYAWLAGWTARVDGHRVPVARADGIVIGVPVPAGRHVVTLDFSPPGWTTGRDLTLVTAAISVGYVAGVSIRRRRRLRHTLG
jgi:hypothetical protein